MANRKVFVSYCHEQKDWVRSRLVPCLDAVEAEVLVDYRRFRVGKALPKQMDILVDEAEIILLVLSPEYLKSGSCCREMDRAIARDPTFEHGTVLPVMRKSCTLPAKILDPDPLYVDISDDSVAERWDEIFAATTGKDLGATAPKWLETRETAMERLLDSGNVYLELSGEVAWERLVESVSGPVAGLKIVDLADGANNSRRGLLETILREAGSPQAVPPPQEDLVTFDLAIRRLPQTKLALLHFDRVANRPELNGDFFDALRSLIEKRHLTVFFLARRPFLDLVPDGHPLSKLTSLAKLRLEARR